MRAARKSLWQLGLVWSVSLVALSAAALAEQDGGRSPEQVPHQMATASNSTPPAPTRDVVDTSAPPDRPEAIAGAGPAGTWADEGTAAAPDLPEAVASVPPPETADGAVAGLALPDPPPAPVSITTDDLIRSALASRLATADGATHLGLPRKEQEALAAFYAQTDHRPLWTGDGAWTSAAKSVMERIRAAGEDGLDPADYPLPPLAPTTALSPDDWAAAELKLSAAAIRYARDARGARIEPSRLSNLITPKFDLPAAGEVLSRLASAGNAGEVLAAYNPPHVGYRALKARLAQLRESRAPRPMVRVPQGPALKLGMRDARVPLIRARFNLGPAGGDQTAYDERIASAVAAFQKEKGLPASGILTARTVAALAGGSSPARLEGDIIANMERWRWLPADLGARHITVNVPEFRLRIIDGGEVVHQTRVIVGRSETPTPIFSDEMEHVVVNPSWTIPPSIMKKEILPALADDPYYAERRGYRVFRRGNRIVVQQPPGERNALGFIKFIFPNQYAVYLHDTPNRKLFSADRRAFSHGCVRVEQPFRLAELVLGSDGNWSEPKLRSLIGKGERHIRLHRSLPVHLTYFTLSIDEHGQIRSFDDIYGIHRKVRAALGLDS